MMKVMSLVMEIVAIVHDSILSMNDSFGLGLTDKQLHFLVFGLAGLMVTKTLRSLFHRTCGDAGIWAASLVLVSAFAFFVEVGQYLTNTGSFEVADILYGVLGFVSMSVLHFSMKALKTILKNFAM